MLISFTLKNWLSFKEESTFSMVASYEKQHIEHVAVIKKFPLKVLPISAIYGGNASGKSNLIKALSFVKEFVINGLAPEVPIPVTPYRPVPNGKNEPSFFSVSMLIDENIYEYSFSITATEIITEQLTVANSSSEKLLFKREKNKIFLGESIKKNRQTLEFIAKTTRKNFLFLTNTVWQNIATFKNVYDWFKDKLQIVFPNSKFILQNTLIGKNNPFAQQVSNMLQKLGTGIDHLDGNEVPIESLDISDEALTKIQSSLIPDKVIVYKDLNNIFYFIYKEKDVIKAKKIVSVHKVNNVLTTFNLSEESDGNLRAIDLIPAFLILASDDNDKVFVIDELDRSLHTKLTDKLISFYLESCNKNKRSQLIFTTHDVMLMSQENMRRDEIWLVERDHNQTSSIFPISDFTEIRSDKNIRKSYLEGRMGGIPNITGNVKLYDALNNEEQIYY